MENILEKVFINNHLGIKFKTYVNEDCNIWFKAKEVAQILGYKNMEHVIKRYVSENHKKNSFFVARLKRAVNKMVAPVKRGVNKMVAALKRGLNKMILEER